jgi:hypothetical protein
MNLSAAGTARHSSDSTAGLQELHFVPRRLAEAKKERNEDNVMGHSIRKKEQATLIGRRFASTKEC